MLNAALSHFVAVRDKAVANINSCLARDTETGEHTDPVGQVIANVAALERANSCIQLLTGLLSAQNQSSEEDVEAEDEEDVEAEDEEDEE